MRYDPEVRASNCYLEFFALFFRCLCSWERIISGIARIQGKAFFSWSFIDLGIVQSRSRVYFYIALIDDLGDRMRRITSEVLSQRFSLPNKIFLSRSGPYFQNISFRLQPGTPQQLSA